MAKPQSSVTETIAYHLRLAQEASFATFRQRCGSPDLKPGRYALLSVIAHNPGLTQGELSRAAQRDTSTLTAALNDLSARGFVRRQRSAADKRSYEIVLTDAGHELLAVLEEHARAHDALLDEIVGSDVRPVFLAALRRIEDVLNRPGINPSVQGK